MLHVKLIQKQEDPLQSDYDLLQSTLKELKEYKKGKNSFNGEIGNNAFDFLSSFVDKHHTHYGLFGYSFMYGALTYFMRDTLHMSMEDYMDIEAHKKTLNEYILVLDEIRKGNNVIKYEKIENLECLLSKFVIILNLYKKKEDELNVSKLEKGGD